MRVQKRWRLLENVAGFRFGDQLLLVGLREKAYPRSACHHCHSALASGARRLGSSFSPGTPLLGCTLNQKLDASKPAVKIGDYRNHSGENCSAIELPFFRPLFDQNFDQGISGRGIMRQPIAVSCTLLLFVVSFSSVYISFRTSTPHIRGLVGGGFFFIASLLLLWNGFASLTLTKRAL